MNKCDWLRALVEYDWLSHLPEYLINLSYKSGKLVKFPFVLLEGKGKVVSRHLVDCGYIYIEEKYKCKFFRTNFLPYVTMALVSNFDRFVAQMCLY